MFNKIKNKKNIPGAQDMLHLEPLLTSPSPAFYLGPNDVVVDVVDMVVVVVVVVVVVGARKRRLIGCALAQEPGCP